MLNIMLMNLGLTKLKQACHRDQFKVLYINDLSTISNTLKCIMYADDTTIYFNTEDFPNDNLAKHITTEFDEVDVWLKHKKMSLNVEKTLNACFSHLHQKLNYYNSQ